MFLAIVALNSSSLSAKEDKIDLTQPPDKTEHTLFIAHFDRTLDADFSKGDGRVKKTGEVSLFEEGKFGKAVDLRNGSLNFSGEGNINLERGTIEFWVRPTWAGDEFEGEWLELFRFYGGRENNIVIVRRHNLAITGTYSGIRAAHWWGVAHEWERDEWHHVVFEYSTKGDILYDGMLYSVLLFIDGEMKAGDRRPGFDKMVVMPPKFTIGGSSVIIDELRISSKPIYTEAPLVKRIAPPDMGNYRMHENIAFDLIDNDTDPITGRSTDQRLCMLRGSFNYPRRSLIINLPEEKPVHLIQLISHCLENPELQPEDIEIFYSSNDLFYTRYEGKIGFNAKVGDDSKTVSLTLNITARYLKIHSRGPRAKPSFRKVEARAHGKKSVIGPRKSGQFLLSSNDDFSFWFEHEVRKILRTDAIPQGKIENQVQIAGAKGERVSFQLVYTPHLARKNQVRLTFTDLMGPEGNLISRENVAVHVVGYIPIETPSWGSFAAEWPDPLMPQDSVVVADKNLNYPFWITIYIPRGSAAGDYKGRFELEIDGVKKYEGDISLRVWGFALPLEPALESIAVFRFHHVLEHSPKADFDDWLKNFSQHRLGGLVGYPHLCMWVEEGRVKICTEKFDRRMEFYQSLHFNIFGLGHVFHGATGTFSCRFGYEFLSPEHRERFTDYPRQAGAHLAERGWIDEAILYLFDEPWVCGYEKVYELFRMVKEADPRLRTFLAEEPIDARLHDVVDVWVPSGSHFDDPQVYEELQKLRKEGRQLSTYFNAFYLTDFPAINARIIGWMAHRFGLQGYLFWGLTAWGAGNPFYTPEAGGFHAFTRNGEGFLLYPSECGAPITSIRWQLLRDGFEDFDYFYLLESKLKDGSLEKYISGRKLLRRAKDTFRSHTDFERDPLVLLQLRKEIAEWIEEAKN